MRIKTHVDNALYLISLLFISEHELVIAESPAGLFSLRTNFKCSTATSHRTYHAHIFFKRRHRLYITAENMGTITHFVDEIFLFSIVLVWGELLWKSHIVQLSDVIWWWLNIKYLSDFVNKLWDSRVIQFLCWSQTQSKWRSNALQCQDSHYFVILSFQQSLPNI